MPGWILVLDHRTKSHNDATLKFFKSHGKYLCDLFLDKYDRLIVKYRYPSDTIALKVSKLKFSLKTPHQNILLSVSVDGPDIMFTFKLGFFSGYCSDIAFVVISNLKTILPMDEFGLCLTTAMKLRSKLRYDILWFCQNRYLSKRANLPVHGKIEELQLQKGDYIIGVGPYFEVSSSSNCFKSIYVVHAGTSPELTDELKMKGDLCLLSEPKDLCYFWFLACIGKVYFGKDNLSFKPLIMSDFYSFPEFCSIPFLDVFIDLPRKSSFGQIDNIKKKKRISIKRHKITTRNHSINENDV